ncbi:tetratricopeptide repeat protein 9C isoform X2 [Ambystoma mexicanum]|uniref:tetratricopeptide repeat protein 9C isoform X2 n=1 Tax=Ambystoma mexicanum TaxID=8296 RepID=UPI0037E8F7E6
MAEQGSFAGPKDTSKHLPTTQMDPGLHPRHFEAGFTTGQLDAEPSFTYMNAEEVDTRPSVQMDARLLQAQLFKEAGNLSYKELRFREAIGKYHRALLQLKGLDPSVPSPLQAFGAERPVVTPEQEKALQSMQRDCYNNLAACLLQYEPVPYDRVKHYSLLVLEREPGNIKALYRAGVACYHLRDLDHAKHYLSEAQSLQPSDPNVRKYMKLTESELNGYHQQEKQLYRGMFK